MIADFQILVKGRFARNSALIFVILPISPPGKNARGSQRAARAQIDLFRGSQRRQGPLRYAEIRRADGFELRPGGDGPLFQAAVSMDAQPVVYHGDAALRQQEIHHPMPAESGIFITRHVGIEGQKIHGIQRRFGKQQQRHGPVPLEKVQPAQAAPGHRSSQSLTCSVTVTLRMRSGPSTVPSGSVSLC